MPKVFLKSEQIGDRTTTPRIRPTLDVEGNPYDETTPAKYNVRGIGNGRFVFIPAAKDSDEWVFELPAQPKKDAKG